MTKIPNITTYLGILCVGDTVELTWVPCGYSSKQVVVSAIWRNGYGISLCFEKDSSQGASYSHNGDILGEVSLVRIIPKHLASIDWEARTRGKLE